MFEAFQWLTAGLSIFGTVINAHGDRRCFYVWSVTNASWCGINLSYGIWPAAALNAVYFSIAIYGLKKWKRE